MIQAESVTVAPSFDKDHSFVGKMTENRILNKKGSAKDTRYFVVNISRSGPACTCGDSRDIDPNNPGYVGQMQSALGFSYDESVNAPKVEELLPRREGFLHKLSRVGLSKKFLQECMLKRSEKLWEWLEGGAYFYICRNVKRMAGDVDLSLNNTQRNTTASMKQKLNPISRT